MNWRCRFGWHHWKTWIEYDYNLGYVFEYMRCDRPGCKWQGLTWVERSPL